MMKDKEYKHKLYDQALVIEDAITPDEVAVLMHHTAKYENYLMDGLTAKDRYFRFINLREPKNNGELDEQVSKAVDSCHEVLFSTIRKRLPSFPLIKPEFYGISLNNFGLEYHADAERPFNKGDRDLGWPTKYDDTGFKLPSQPEWQLNHSPSRVYTSLIYLNEDFSGGETTLPIKRLNVRPKKGRLFSFPCSRDYIHGVRPVENGLRVVFTAWYKLEDHPFTKDMDMYGQIDHGCPVSTDKEAENKT